MVECPFCGSEVSEDLVTYGGTCPKCFAEIPGDEAPTDPGAEVRAAQERRDRRGRTIRIFIGFALLLMLVTCTGGGAVWAVFRPKPEVAELLNFDELDIPLPDLVGAPEEGDPAPGSKKQGNGGTSPKPGGTSTGGTGTGGTSTGGTSPKPGSSIPSIVTPVPVAEPSGMGTRPRSGTRNGDPGGPVDPTASTGSGSPKPKVDLSIKPIEVTRDETTVYTDPELIRGMIAERLKAQIPELRICYDRRLKVEPTLKGRWLLKFNVQPNGRVQGATATGVERRDAELEECIVRHIESNWRFGKMNVTQPVQRTVTLSN